MSNAEELPEIQELTQFNCVNCPNKIPVSRFARKASTCSKKCANAIKLIRRQQRESHYCRLCSKPSTPEQRKAWREFAKTLPRNKPGRPAKPKTP